MAKLHLRQRAKTFRHHGNGIAIFLGDLIGEKIICDGFFSRSELETLDRLVLSQVDAGSICLDIGANIGNHARFFESRFTHVFAFEPHPRTSLLLRANAMGHAITALDYGLSDRSAKLSAVTECSNMGASRVAGATGAGDTVFEVNRLDDVIAGLSQAPIGFVKIDVEGHEAEVIRGGGKTLQTGFPPVALEVLSDTIRNGSSEAIDELRALGYSHFHGMINTAGWTRMPWKPLRLFTRSLLRLFAPSRIDVLELEPIQSLRPEGYPIVIASKGPLRAG